MLIKSLYQAVGTNIRVLRRSKNLTQFDLSELAKVDRSYLAKLECGKANPSVYTLNRLAEALEVPVYKLVKSGNTAS